MANKELAEIKKINTNIHDLKEICNEMLKWIKFEVRQNVIKIIREELDDDNKKIIYELSNGNSSPDIASIVKLDSSMVRYYWHKWAEIGIMEICPNYKRRCCSIFSLKELGIEVPEYIDADKE